MGRKIYFNFEKKDNEQQLAERALCIKRLRNAKIDFEEQIKYTNVHHKNILNCIDCISIEEWDEFREEIVNILKAQSRIIQLIDKMNNNILTQLDNLNV